MSVIQGLFVSVTLSALIMALHCKADQYPQQWNLTYKWLDRFTVNISWKKPIGLADDSGIKYCMKNIEDDNDEVRVNDKLEIIKTLLTEEKRTDSWTYHIWTIGDNSSQSNESVPCHVYHPHAKTQSKSVSKLGALLQVRITATARTREPCQKTSPGKSSMEIIYNKNCQYEFKSRVMTTEYCFSLSSTFAEPVIYGTNKTPDETLTVVAIFIPIILSACIILSCYCFRRYRAIICPVIPDPSAIFKEMIMNGNSDHKATQTKLYTPVPEPIEPCKITLVSENSPMQQNY
ncbi:hypothetical protein E3U43_007972 [Larimichthys crocea]|uniref:Uncharacterized protein n=1 Tax=Larimichthys crocea TaxID=215358 RepID=A0ACD3Q608_LARCR|nr:hypothetical protein E3U43_007972 [Larimichthys crocea]